MDALTATVLEPVVEPGLLPAIDDAIRGDPRKPRVREVISSMLADREKKEDFGSVFFYVKLLFM